MTGTKPTMKIMKTAKEITTLIQAAKSNAGVTDTRGGYERNSTNYPGDLDEAAVSMLTDAAEGDREELTALCDLLDELKEVEEIETANECNATLAADSADNARLNAEIVKYSTVTIVITSTHQRADKNGRRKVKYMAALLYPGKETARWGNLGTAEPDDWAGYQQAARELLKKQAGDFYAGIGNDAGCAFLVGAPVYFAPCGHCYA